MAEKQQIQIGLSSHNFIGPMGLLLGFGVGPWSSLKKAIQFAVRAKMPLEVWITNKAIFELEQGGSLSTTDVHQVFGLHASYVGETWGGFITKLLNLRLIKAARDLFFLLTFPRVVEGIAPLVRIQQQLENKAGKIVPCVIYPFRPHTDMGEPNAYIWQTKDLWGKQIQLGSFVRNADIVMGQYGASPVIDLYVLRQITQENPRLGSAEAIIREYGAMCKEAHIGFRSDLGLDTRGELDQILFDVGDGPNETVRLLSLLFETGFSGRVVIEVTIEHIAASLIRHKKWPLGWGAYIAAYQKIASRIQWKFAIAIDS